MPLLKKGALKKILNKFESGAQVCPDMSGKPLGFASSFTAFLVLLGKVTIKRGFKSRAGYSGATITRS